MTLHLALESDVTGAAVVRAVVCVAAGKTPGGWAAVSLMALR